MTGTSSGSGTSPDHERAVLFDMDGVLVDSTLGHVRAWERFLDEHRLDAPAEGVRSLFGRPASEAVAALLGAPIGSQAQRDALAALDRHADAQFDAQGPGGLLVPEAADVVDEVRRSGWRVAVGTSATRAGAQRGLGALWTAFEAVVTAEDVARGKPAPEVYLTAADRLGVAPSACVVVEDAPVGVRAGKAAGMRVIGVTGTVPGERLLAVGADHVVDGLHEVPALLPSAGGQIGVPGA